jgi:hypothetical protein
MNTEEPSTDTQSSPPEFSIREFLREREALLVHFSTPMSNHREIYFPDDLRTAARIQGKGLFFSTIQANDIGPHQDPAMEPGDANAGGSIGLIVDIPSNDCVTAVGPHDGGGFEDLNGETVSAGLPPTAETCGISIDRRTSCNEWVVRDYRPVGIFAFCPIRVSGPAGEGPIREEAAFELFREYRIFSVRNGSFVEYDRQARGWKEVTYAEIMAATPAVTG